MLTGEKTILRAWHSDDLPVLQMMRNDLRLQQQLMTHPRGNSIDQVKDWLNVRTKASDGLFLVIACKSSDRAVGYIQVTKLDLLNGLGRLGICIEPASQGKGYGGESIALLEQHLHRVFGLRKLTLQVLAENERAIRLYARSGYREAGRLREHFYIGGKFSDVVLMERFIGS